MTSDKMIETICNILSTEIAPLPAVLILSAVSFAAGYWGAGL